jgi:prefoldin subunit 5
MLEFRSSDELKPGAMTENAIENENALNKILNQIKKQTERQVKMEKTLSLLDNSVKEIIRDLRSLDNQTQRHQQMGDSIKQIQSQTSQLQKKMTNIERSIGNIVTTLSKKKKGKKKNKKGKKKQS